MDIDAEELEALYSEHFPTLAEMAIEQFGLSSADAEDLVDEVFIASILNLPRIVDMKPWLTSALTYAAREHAQRGA
jgi:DNA-directed RNA polymerase specialized sigma24 family protein